MKIARDAKDAGYLCGDCAEGAGGIWPKGHVATWHEGTCGMCLKPKMLTAWDDWTWPESALDEEASFIREF